VVQPAHPGIGLRGCRSASSPPHLDAASAPEFLSSPRLSHLAQATGRRRPAARPPPPAAAGRRRPHPDARPRSAVPFPSAPSPLIRRPGAASPGQTATGWASPALLPFTGGLRPSPLMPLLFFFLSAHLLDATVGSGRQATTVFPDAILDVQPRTAGALASG